MKRLATFLVLTLSPLASAQYTAYVRHGATRGFGVLVATGDSRAVTEPTYPTVCTQVQATKYVVSTNKVNIDPWNGTCGSTGGTFGTLGCTGGTDDQPSSTASSYTAAETLDNTAVRNALTSTACAGKAVELVPGAGGQMGIVMSPFSLPSGVSLILDPGIHVYASRNLSDYGGTNCGQINNVPPSCAHWITAPNTSGSGIYGPGVLDGRGWAAYIGTPTQSFYANRVQAYCNNRGGPSDGSPTCTKNSAGDFSYGPNLMNLITANNFTLYHVTLKDCGNFCLNLKTSNGFTGWDVKIIAPFEVSNTDGFDPLDSKNVTLTKSFISNGDNHMAVKSTGAGASNITVSNSQTGAGIGLAIGAGTKGGVSNVLVTDIVQKGNPNNPQSTGLEIASDPSEGGLVDTITFRNICAMNESRPIRVYGNYGGKTGTSYSTFQNVLFRNVNVLADSAGNSGFYTFQGLSGHPMSVQLDSVNIVGKNQGVTGTDQYAHMLIGPSFVHPSILSQLATPGTGNTTTGTGASTTPYPCTTSTWQPLTGVLNVATSTSNVNGNALTASGTITLQAMVRPTTDISKKEQPALTAPITFLDGGVSVGTAPLAPDGTYAKLSLSSSSGIHVYTAKYPGDSNYPSYTFGSVTVTGTFPVTIPGTATAYTGLEKLSGWVADASASISPHPPTTFTINQSAAPVVMTLDTVGTSGLYTGWMARKGVTTATGVNMVLRATYKFDSVAGIQAWEVGRRRTNTALVTDNGQTQLVPKSGGVLEFDVVPSSSGGWADTGCRFPTFTIGTLYTEELYYVNDPDGALSLEYVSLNGTVCTIPSGLQHIAGSVQSPPWAANVSSMAFQPDANPSATPYNATVTLSAWVW